VKTDEKFWARVSRNGPVPPHRPDLGQCWVWTKTLRKGYGWFYSTSRGIGAHRYSWQLHSGPIPRGMCVCHACDNPRCIRPSHLFLGTRADNNRDRDAKGRQRTVGGDDHHTRKNPEEARRIARWVINNPERRATGDRHGSRRHPEMVARGERQGLAKLTAESVRNIRAAVAGGQTISAVARAAGVDRRTIRSVVTRRTWAHVE
jgi:hypothetical protein